MFMQADFLHTPKKILLSKAAENIQIWILSNRLKRIDFRSSPNYVENNSEL